MKLSIIILSRNEEQNSPRCLSSVSWCQEVIVIDDFSTDKTLEICKRFPVTVFQRHLNGNYAAQRNFGMSKVTGDWVLFIDADEVVSDKLVSEIKVKINDAKYHGYYLKRLDNFWGKTLHFGEAGNIKLLRLARKDGGSWERKVHEVWEIGGEVEQLKNPIFHFSHPTVSEFILSINHHTDIDAVELSREGKRFNYFRVVLNPLGKFLTNYFLKLGFLDGQVGLVYAYMMSLHSLTVRVKQYEH